MQTASVSPINIHDYKAGKFISATGNLIDINNPAQSNLCIEDIAIGLSNICRFGGQIRNPYNVAQHSIFVMCLAPDELKKEALFHDAAESYVGDVIKPIKHILGSAYAEIEEAFLVAICERFGVDIYKMMDVKPYDMQALELEHEALQMGNPVPLMVSMNKHRMPEPTMHFCWDNVTARRMFLEQYYKLFQ